MRKELIEKSANGAQKRSQKDTLYVLEKIHELLAYVKGDVVGYSDYFDGVLPNPSSSTSQRAEELILDRLQDLGVIKIQPRELTLSDISSMKFIGSGHAVMPKALPSFIAFEVNREQLKKIYAEYKQAKIDINDSSLLMFYLTLNGLLYRTLHSGSRQEYQMAYGKQKHRLIEMLTNEAPDPVSADDLAKKINTKAANIRKEIGVLRQEIETHFEGIDGKDFIPDAQKGIGYCLGPRIKITRK